MRHSSPRLDHGPRLLVPRRNELVHFCHSFCHGNRMAAHWETLASALFNLRALKKGSESGEEKESMEELAGKMLGWWKKMLPRQKGWRTSFSGLWMHCLAGWRHSRPYLLPLEKRGRMFKLHQQLPLPPPQKMIIEFTFKNIFKPSKEYLARNCSQENWVQILGQPN